VLVVDAGSERTWRYWELQPQPELRYRSDQEYVDHFRSLLFEAVGARLRSAHAIGGMLSGGLDSASVVCIAQELYRAGRAVDRGFVSFSLVFDDLACDEASLVRDVQANYPHAARLIPAAEQVSALSLTPAGFMRGPDKAVSELDALYAAASNTGTRVLLSGDVADSCLLGSRLVFDSLLRQLRIRALWRHLRTYQRLSAESLHKTVALYCLLPLFPLWLQRRLMAANVRREVARYGDQLLPRWMTETLRADLLDRHTRLSLAAEHNRRFASPAREHELRLLYPPEVSRGPTGWPLEVWRPFADRRLHDFLLAVPPEQKFEPHPATDDFYAGSKLILRRAMRGILPESIRARTTKTHFASLFRSELERRWSDYAAAFGPAGRSELAARGYIDPRLFWARLEELRDGDWGADFMYVLRSVAVETWLRSLQLPRLHLVHVAAPHDVTFPRSIARAAMRHQQVSLGKEVILR
jgi:asparagine synthase (glutamine-hydrolysing)